MIWLTLVGCGSEVPSELALQPQTAPVQQTSPEHPPQNQAPPNMPGLSSFEDLTSSWREELKQPVPDVPATLKCTDTEGYVPSGPFLMGSISSHAGADEGPVHVVSLSEFCLDLDEVSTADFAAWLKKNNRAPQGNDIRHISADGTVETGREAHPAEGVTWQEAENYCIDQDKLLPTEAQWERAARGGCELGSDPTQCDPEDLRAYPWGNAVPSCDRANHQLSASDQPQLCVSDTLLPDALPLGNGPYGHRHLAGNVWEFVRDSWHPSVYATDRINPSGPASGDIHVLRGGGWNTFSTNMRVANRFHDLVMGSAAGFRCARSTTNFNSDNVVALELASVSGTITSKAPLKGRALYITAFDANDADDSGMLAPGRSPIAEIQFQPNGSTQQTFSIDLPIGGSYILSSALDAGTGASKEDYISASGSGGFGQAKGNPISVQGTLGNIEIEILIAPAHPKGMQNQHKGKAPGRPPGTPPPHHRKKP